MPRETGTAPAPPHAATATPRVAGASPRTGSVPLAGAALLLLLLVALGALAYRSAMQLARDGEAMQQSQRTLTVLARLRTTVAESGPSTAVAAAPAVEGVAEGGRPAQAQAQAQLDELRALRAADTESYNRVVALGTLLSRHFDVLGAVPEARPRRSAASPIATPPPDNAALRQRVQAALADLEQRAQAELLQQAPQVDAAARRARWAVLALAGLAAALVGTAGWRLARDRGVAGRARIAEQAAEEARQRSDTALQRLFDLSFDAICVIDAEGRLARVGAGCARLSGLPPAALRGKPYTDVVWPEDRRRTEHAAAAVPAAPASSEWHSRCRRADGSVAHAVWRAQRLGEDGSLLCLVRDVSDAELAGAQAARQAQALQACKADLAAAREQAAATAALRSAFMTQVGAGLRSSPVAIVSLADNLLQGLAGPLNTEQQRELSRLRETAHSLRSRIGAVLDLSLIDGGQLELAREHFDLWESVTQLVASMRDSAERKGLSVDARIADDLGYARGDAVRVEQVLRELIEQAVRATPAGRVSVQAASPAGGLIRISVSDGGPGLDAEALQQVFDPFRAGGAGLGLALARQLARLMGGDLTVHSAPPSGSTYTFTLRADDLQTG